MGVNRNTLNAVVFIFRSWGGGVQGIFRDFYSHTYIYIVGGGKTWCGRSEYMLKNKCESGDAAYLARFWAVLCPGF